MRPAIDLTGRVFGRLTVLERASRLPTPGQARWSCRCSCGGLTIAGRNELLRGSTSSCGCLGRERLGVSTRTHGMSSTPAFRQWSSMWERCANPASKDYSRYGGRGIRVCDRWKDFALFYSDMGERPAGTTLDRRDNDRDYDPGNCRWATPKEQAANRSNTAILTRRGESKPLTAWADELGLSRKTIHTRLSRGWSHEAALAPVERGR